MESRELAIKDTAAGSPRHWTVAACVIFGLAALQTFHGCVDAGVDAAVPIPIGGSGEDEANGRDWTSLNETDVSFMVWLTARNARALWTKPGAIFQTEQCYPGQNTLSLGDTAIEMGLLGVPFDLLGAEPVTIYNAVLVSMALLGAIAMYLLVRDWTAQPAAGLAAGLLFGFHHIKIGDPAHAAVWDNAWTIFALYFTVRLFRDHRWRDALGLSVAVCMQLASSLYVLMAAALVGLPFLLWQLWQLRGRALPLPQLGVVVIVTLAVGVLLIGPYFSKAGTGEISQAAFQAFRPLSYVLPGGPGFEGWVISVLAIAGLVLGRAATGAGIDGDPRLALAVGGALVFACSVVGLGDPGQDVIAVGPQERTPGGIPNLYLLLGRLEPSLLAARAPGAIYSGFHLVVCIFAGLGAAALLRIVPARYAFALALCLLLAATIDMLRPSWLGLEPKVEFRWHEVRPPDDTLEFFVGLERLGDEGPLFEYPVNRTRMWDAAASVLLTAYHGRPTSRCYNSFMPLEWSRLDALADRLPEREALAELRQLGFKTLLVHHEAGGLMSATHRSLFARYAEADGQESLSPLAQSSRVSAYRIEP